MFFRKTQTHLLINTQKAEATQGTVWSVEY